MLVDKALHSRYAAIHSKCFGGHANTWRHLLTLPLVEIHLPLHPPERHFVITKLFNDRSIDILLETILTHLQSVNPHYQIRHSMHHYTGSKAFCPHCDPVHERAKKEGTNIIY